MEEKTRQLKQYSQLESRVQMRLRIQNLREYSREWGQHTEEKTRQSEQQGNQLEVGFARCWKWGTYAIVSRVMNAVSETGGY